MRYRSVLTLCILVGACRPVAETPVLPEESPQGFSASIDSKSSDFTFKWSKGDRISINGNAFYTSLYGGEDTTLFVCSGAETLPEDGTGKYEAFWPHDLVYSDPWNGTNISLPAAVNYREDEVIRPPMYACSETKELAFGFLTGILRVNVSLQSDSIYISSISIRASKALSGLLSVSEDGRAVMKGTTGGIRMKVGRKMHQDEGLSAYFNIPEEGYDEFEICITDDKGASMVYKVKDRLEVRAGKLSEESICINPDDYVLENCIYYISSDGKPIEPYDMQPISNVYADGVGVMTFASAISTIKSNAFRNEEGYCTDASRLVKIMLPQSVKSIGNYVFRYCTRLEKFSIPVNGQYTSISSNILEGCTSLEEIYVPDNVTKINNNAFMGCISLKKVRLPDHIDKIPQNTFNGCTSLKTVNMPSVLSVIGVKAFMGTAIEEIQIPSGVITLNSQTFQDCTALKVLKLLKYDSDGNITALSNKNALKNCPSLTSIVVPQGSADIYKSASNWSEFKDIIRQNAYENE